MTNIIFDEMKKIFVSLVLSCILLGISTNGLSQSYQIPNGDFEMKFDKDGEPPHWNSFMTFDCTLGSIICGFAKNTQHSQESGRPGSPGQQSIRIYSTAVVGVVANGTMTLGRIHVGSSTANNSANYNFTQRSDSNFSCLFPSTATPDSLYIWVKYTAASGQNARVSAIIHGNSDFKDPNDANTANLYKGKAILNFPPTDWVLKKIPFNYDGTCTDAINYIIVTFTSNATPGGGAANDALYIDDIELIYSAWLTDIKIDGQTISGFAPGIFTYDTVYPRGTNPATAIPNITWTSEKNDVTIKDTLIVGVNNGIDSAKKIIQVKAEDSVTIKTYIVNFSIWKSSDATINQFAYTLNNGAPNTVTVPAQTPDSATQHIYISLSPGTSHTPVITSTSFILADTGAKVISLVQATTPNSTATITVRAENGKIKTYQIYFSVQTSNNADLKTLTYGPPVTSVPNFHPDTLVYNVTLAPGTMNPPQVAATMDWPGLTPTIQQATTLPWTAIITATAEDGITQKIYTVHFTVMLDTNANLSTIKYNYQGGGSGKTITVHSDTLSYSIVLPYGTTQITSLSATCASPRATSAPSPQAPFSLPKTATIIVTAQNPAYTKTYTINFSVAKNNDASLSAIKYKLDGDTLSVKDFNPLKEHYQEILPSRTASAPVLVYYLQDSNASAVVIDPQSTQDTGKITVTAENGTTTKTYTVVFSVALSTNVSLDSIKIKDTVTHFDTTLFAPSLSSYNINLDTNLIPIITVATADTRATYNIIYPNSIPGQAQIIVTAEDTNVKKTYRLNLSFATPDNPNLVDLSYELAGTLYSVSNFHQDTLTYYIVLPSQTVEVPKIVCQTADFSASPAITQPAYPNGAGIIVVVSSNGDSTKIYQIHFSVEISTNAKLDSLFYNGIPISGFSPSQQSYTIELPYTTTLPATVSAKAQSKAAKVDYAQPSKIQDSAVVLVTAEDKQTACRYVVHFTRELSPVASLSTLAYTLSGADSTIADFEPDVNSYTVLIAPETVSVPQLVFTPADANATAQLLRTPLQTNDTAIIRVTAENQTDFTDYTIVFSRIPSSNNRLSDLQYNGISLSKFYP
ncbi:MAG: hypothetical protein LBE13_19085, partial [Bacteroidales bacterium]|nr:hypothetical protein [Bacteroidales bacterium]